MSENDLLLLVLAGPFAVHRLTRLLLVDRILRRPRAAVIRLAYRGQLAGMGPADVEDFPRADPDPPALAYLFTCWWCLGLWVSVGWTVACWAWWGPMRWATLAAAFSTQAALLSTALTRLEA